MLFLINALENNITVDNFRDSSIDLPGKAQVLDTSAGTFSERSWKFVQEHISDFMQEDDEFCSLDVLFETENLWFGDICVSEECGTYEIGGVNDYKIYVSYGGTVRIRCNGVTEFIQADHLFFNFILKYACRRGKYVICAFVCVDKMHERIKSFDPSMYVVSLYENNELRCIFGDAVDDLYAVDYEEASKLIMVLG